MCLMQPFIPTFCFMYYFYSSNCTYAHSMRDVVLLSKLGLHLMLFPADMVVDIPVLEGK